MSSSAPQLAHRLACEVRRHGGALLADVSEPHDELMSLVWGPRFDREHALGLLARRPSIEVPVLPALMAAADAFDALQGPAQQRLRRLILRHRALRALADVSAKGLPGEGGATPAPAPTGDRSAHRATAARSRQRGAPSAEAVAPASACGAPM